MIPGTLFVPAMVAPGDPADHYPTHDANFGKGGLVEAVDITARDAIPSQRRRAGMLCFVDANSSYYQLQEDLTTWLILSSISPTQSQVELGVGTTLLDSLDITTNRTTRWVVEFRKSTQVVVLEIVASHNGILVAEQHPTAFQIGTGTFDVSEAVSIVSGQMQLNATAGSSGWVALWQRIYSMTA